jgi:hypothetical protein
MIVENRNYQHDLWLKGEDPFRDAASRAEYLEIRNLLATFSEAEIEELETTRVSLNSLFEHLQRLMKAQPPDIILN